MPDSPANDEEYAPGTRSAPGSERSAKYQMVRTIFWAAPCKGCTLQGFVLGSSTVTLAFGALAWWVMR